MNDFVPRGHAQRFGLPAYCHRGLFVLCDATASLPPLSGYLSPLLGQNPRRGKTERLMKYSQERKQAVLAELEPPGDTDALTQALVKAYEEQTRVPLPVVNRR